MTLVLVLNYGFLSSFKNVLPNSNLLAREFTFHNSTAAKAVAFEVTSLIATSDWNEIRLALASPEKKVVFVTLFRICFFRFRVRVSSALNLKKSPTLRHGYFAHLELHNKHSKQLNLCKFRIGTLWLNKTKFLFRFGTILSQQIVLYLFPNKFKGKRRCVFLIAADSRTLK